MRASAWLLVMMLLISSHLDAKDADVPLDLIELLGEMDEEGTDSLAIALEEVQVKKASQPKKPDNTSNGGEKK